MNSLLRILAIVLVSISSIHVFAVQIPGEATYYSDRFEGKKTANGEIFRQTGFTAAYCGVTLGKNIYVSRGSTGVLVRANDRPASCSEYSLVDLTTQAFSFLGPLSSGRLKDIKIDTLGRIEPSSFASLGVIVDNLFTAYFAGDVIEIRGSVLDEKKSVILYFQNEDTKEKFSSLYPVESRTKNFKIRLRLPKMSGRYIMVLASGNSFETKAISYITLYDRESYYYSIQSLPQKEYGFTPIFQGIGKVPSFYLGDSLWGSLEIKQDTVRYMADGSAFLFDTPRGLRVGSAQVSLTGYLLGSGGPLDRIGSVQAFFSREVFLDKNHDSIGIEKVRVRNHKLSTTVKFKVPESPRIRGEYYLTLPNGDVRGYSFSDVSKDAQGYLMSGSSLSISVPMNQTGTYMIEAVQEDGTAYFNFPIIRGSYIWPIIPRFDQKEAAKIVFSSTMVEKYVLRSINTLRQSLGRSQLIRDPDMTLLAQTKAEDMSTRQYSGHYDSENRGIGYLQNTLGLKLGKYQENIGYGEGGVSHVILQDGLEESGSHRAAMLNPKYSKIGIGYVRKNNQTYLVHIIGE